MCTDDSPEFFDDTSSDTRSDATDEPTTPAAEPTARSSWNRRTFLKAAALGTAAAALLNRSQDGGWQFGPLAALADDLSGLNCTANDVRIVGPGQIINEPCDCTGRFNAQVRFRVINNTGTTRYCVTVHFCPSASGFAPGDIQIGDIPPKSDAFYTVTIPNYPCGSGLQCFGACGTGTDPDTGQSDCSFAKGEGCPTGQCCTTISWDVNPGCPTRVIGSKCRHQQVCIQGRGTTTVDCNTSLTGVQTNCAVQCGATTTIRVCTTEAASFGPFLFTLTGGGQTQTFTGTGLCHDFTVGPITTTTAFTGTVRSNDGCTKSASVTLTTTPVPAPTLTQTSANCAGVVVLTATAQGGNQAGDTFNFSGASGTVSGNTITLQPQLDGVCRTVSVTLTRNGCTSGAASFSCSQCVTTTAC